MCASATVDVPDDEELAVPVKVPEFPSQNVKPVPASTVGGVQIEAVIAALLEGHPEDEA